MMIDDENLLSVSQLTEQQFVSFEKVRKSGCYNMIMNGRDAAEAAGLSVIVYMSVLKNYEALMKKFPNVRK